LCTLQNPYIEDVHKILDQQNQEEFSHVYNYKYLKVEKNIVMMSEISRI